MSDSKLTFYEAAFHTITVDAENAAQAEQVAASYVTRFPGSARKNRRAMVRWNVEEIGGKTGS